MWEDGYLPQGKCIKHTKSMESSEVVRGAEKEAPNSLNAEMRGGGGGGGGPFPDIQQVL